MLQVMSLPYLLQSLVPAKAAVCVPLQPRATVHHYPSHCKREDRSSTESSERTAYEYATNEDASYVVLHNLQKNTAAGYGARQSAANTDVVCERPCVVKRGEKGYGILSGAQSLNNAGYAVGIPVQAIKTEGCQTQYSLCPIDTYNSPQIRYSVDYQVENLPLRSRRSLSASRTVMSPDTDSLLALGPLPLSPLALSNQSTYYSATDADFATLYDLPADAPFNSSSLELYGGNSDDMNSPVFTKMADPTGGTCELLSLSDISESELGYDNYLCREVNSGLDQDWLVEPVSLPSPEEQGSDVKLTVVTPPALPQTLSFQYSPSPVTSTPSLLTPDSSLPGSPSSLHSYLSEEEEIKDVLSFFDDGESNFDTTAAVQPFTPGVMMSAVSPSPLLDVDSPSSSCLLLSPSPSIQDSEDDCDSSGDVLDRRDSSASLPNITLQTSALGESGSMDKSRKRKSLSISSTDKQSCAPSPAVKRRLTKTAKKERKREQNKTAALRYRQKKKEEKSDIETRRTELEEKNQKLKAEVNSLSNEINYLKKLWSEVCRNKKELKESTLS